MIIDKSPKIGEMFYTDPSALKELVDPDALKIPGNFYVSEALNFIDDKGLYEGRPLEDNRAYALGKLTMHPLLYSSSGTFTERRGSLHVVQGDPYKQGAAFMNVIGKLEELKALPDGPLVRLHSACGYSEVGQYITSLLYSNPAWLYEHANELLPSFVQYGDGLVMGYPVHDAIEKSMDCDCRAQRKLAQFVIAAVGGIYVSLAGDPQEGRGLGIEAKKRIYWEQEHNGLDTVEACDKLELPYDIRNYEHVIDIFKEWGLTKISLMTNNPRKIAAFEKHFEVKPVHLIPAWLTEAARDYVLTKKRLGHLLDQRTEFIFNGGEVTPRDVPAHMDNPYIFSSSVRIIDSSAAEHYLVKKHDDYPVI